MWYSNLFPSDERRIIIPVHVWVLFLYKKEGSRQLLYTSNSKLSPYHFVVSLFDHCNATSNDVLQKLSSVDTS
jgi:hypothetical protein